MPYLKVIRGRHAGQIWELQVPETIIGRHPDSDIPISRADVSRHHAKLVRGNDGWFLEDLGSRNGTRLNDLRVVNRERVKDGDRIWISGTVFKFFGTLGIGSQDPVAGPADSDSDFTSAAASSAQGPLEAMSEATRRLRHAISVDRVLSQTLEAVFSIFPACEHGVIAIRDEAGEFVPRWAKLRDGDVGNCEFGLRISRAVVRAVVESGRAIRSADLADDPRFLASRSLAQMPFHSLLCAPLWDESGEAMGVVQIATIQNREAFAEEDSARLEAVALQAAVAIENARLCEAAIRGASPPSFSDSEGGV